MAKFVLEILDGDRAGDVVAIADRALRVGRKADNDLVLADEKTSGAHAEIVSEGDRYLLRDLGSTNGTFLDGKRVTELVLSAGDVVTFGRIRCRFRSSDGAPAAAEGAELAVHRLDTSRLRKSSRSTVALAAALAVGLAAGGWFLLQGRRADGGGNTAGKGQPKPTLVVGGNKLPIAAAACETEEGWLLRAAGCGFTPGGEAHTGSSGFTARRVDGAAADFAVLRLSEALSVFQQRTLTLRAHVRTASGGAVAVRAVLAAANEQSPFVFRTGTAMASPDEWTAIETVVAVPPGCDRLQFEIAALLPAAESAVHVDDCAVLEAGSASASEARFGDGSPAAIGTGAAVALRSVDADDPAIALAVLPASAPASYAGLLAADLCVLSDFGGTISATPTDAGFVLAAKGVDALQFVFPAAAAAGLMARRGDAFAPIAADGEFAANSVLVGKDLNRVELRLGPPAAPGAGSGREGLFVGRAAGGRYRLTAPSDQIDVQLSFRSERQQASELVRQARRARDEGRPGEALDALAVVSTRWPMDTEILAQSTTLAAEILTQQGARLGALQRELEEAAFFSTRGGFERVAQGVDELVALYGERNLADPAATTMLREQARARLAAVDALSADQQRQRLRAMERAFVDARQPGLAKLVQDYIGKNLGTER
jgi:hypothetical protein